MMNTLSMKDGALRRLVIALTAGMLASACAAPRADQDVASTLEIELVAIRSVLSAYAPGSLAIDSLYANPNEAPPTMTSRARPSDQQHALSDSIGRNLNEGGRDTLLIRSSLPIVNGPTANISVTVSQRDATQGRSGFYETVSFVLESRGGQWSIRERSQLGIS